MTIKLNLRCLIIISEPINTKGADINDALDQENGLNDNLRSDSFS